jgi:DNA ligase (NAD+)
VHSFSIQLFNSDPRHFAASRCHTQVFLLLATHSATDLVPSISDAAYDGILREYSSLVAQLPEADRQALQSRAVAPTPDASGSATIMHRWPMLSLDKVYDAHLLAEFDGAMRAKHADVAPAYVCEPKVTG